MGDLENDALSEYHKAQYFKLLCENARLAAENVRLRAELERWEPVIARYKMLTRLTSETATTQEVDDDR